MLKEINGWRWFSNPALPNTGAYAKRRTISGFSSAPTKKQASATAARSVPAKGRSVVPNSPINTAGERREYRSLLNLLAFERKKFSPA